MKSRTATEYALDQVRGSQGALRASQLTLEVLLQMAAEGRASPSAQSVAEWRSVYQVQPADGATAGGDLFRLLLGGPRTRENVAVLNCFFAVGIVDRLASLPRENRRGFAHEIVGRADFLLSNTGYSPYAFLPYVSPPELGILVWDALVSSLVEEVNRTGEPPSALALLRAEELRHLPIDGRRAYLRRIFSECHNPDASLQFASLLSAFDEPHEEDAPMAAPPPPPPRPSAAPPPPRATAAPLPPRTVEPTDAVAAVRGELASGPAGLLMRALLLLSGILLVRDVCALLLRLFGVRRSTALILAEGELVAEEQVRLFRRTLWNRRRAYAAPSIAQVSREVPYARLYLLLVLSGVTLGLALLLPVVGTEGSDASRYAMLAACGAVLAGIALDLLRFLGTYLRRGQSTVTVGLHGGDTYRLARVPEAAAARFAEVARMHSDTDVPRVVPRGTKPGRPFPPRRGLES